MFTLLQLKDADDYKSWTKWVFTALSRSSLESRSLYWLLSSCLCPDDYLLLRGDVTLFLLIMTIRKGKRLFKRILPLFSNVSPFRRWLCACLSLCLCQCPSVSSTESGPVCPHCSSPKPHHNHQERCHRSGSLSKRSVHAAVGEGCVLPIHAAQHIELLWMSESHPSLCLPSLF